MNSLFLLLSTTLLTVCYAQTRLLQVTGSRDDGTGVITLNLDVYERSEPVIAFLTIWSRVPNSYPDSCRTDTTNAPTISLGATQVDGNGENYRRAVVQLDDSPSLFANAGGTDIGCEFTYDGAELFSFYVRVFENAAAGAPVPINTDREFSVNVVRSQFPSLKLNIIGSSFSDGWTDHVVTNVVAEDSITMTLEVVDHQTRTVQTAMELGKAAELKFTLATDPYEVGTSIAGARVRDCIVDSASSFAATPLTIIDNNGNDDGCFAAYNAATQYLFYNTPTTDGFEFDSATQTGTVRTFTAFSAPFEMSGFNEADTSSATSALHFRCSVTFCYSTANTGIGQCGGKHCDPSQARRKRSVNERLDGRVTAKINIIPKAANVTDQCQDCSETNMYKGVMAALTTISVVLFGAMVFVYLDVSKTFQRLANEKRDKQYNVVNEKPLISSH